MDDRWRFLLNRLRERLWVRPLAMCVLSIGALFVAGLFDEVEIPWLPEVTRDSVESLLSIMAASMLVIATFAVGSMVSAYASAASSATPRSFPLILADDTSQNALSTFVGAFIYSIFALVASKNGLFEQGGLFALFVLTLGTFAVVILTFVRWVDNIARLGRLGTTIDKVEHATAKAMRRRRTAPRLGGVAPVEESGQGEPLRGAIGYVQRVDLARLQEVAAAEDVHVTIAALPGAFACSDRPLAFVSRAIDEPARERMLAAFVIGDDRTFDEDPRFGLVVLAEIASRALSPAVNDAGTAIDVIGSLIRLFSAWGEPLDDSERERSQEPTFDRVAVPELELEDLFDDAFPPIARDGAKVVEVQGRLQKAFAALAACGDGALAEVAAKHSKLALERAEDAMTAECDRDVVRRLAARVG